MKVQPKTGYRQKDQFELFNLGSCILMWKASRALREQPKLMVGLMICPNSNLTISRNQPSTEPCGASFDSPRIALHPHTLSYRLVFSIFGINVRFITIVLNFHVCFRISACILPRRHLGGVSRDFLTSSRPPESNDGLSGIATNRGT